MDLRLAGRPALVTASSSGLGAAIARGLAAEGCPVLVHGRDRARAEAAADELRSAGGVAETVLGDVTDPDDLDRIAAAATAFGVAILINNAGPVAQHDWRTGDARVWRDSWAGNVLSAVALIRALVPGMRSAGWGRGDQPGQPHRHQPGAEPGRLRGREGGGGQPDDRASQPAPP